MLQIAPFRNKTIGEIQWNYMLAACPSDEIRQYIYLEIETIKKEGLAVNASGIEGMLPFANFCVSDDLEPTIIRWMHRICAKRKAFSVTFNNFSATPAGNVHLRITDANVFQHLKNDLAIIDQYIRSNGYSAIQFHKSINLPLINETKELNIRSVMLQYAQRSFYATSNISKIFLLKRSGAHDKAQVVNVFNLVQEV